MIINLIFKIMGLVGNLETNSIGGGFGGYGYGANNFGFGGGGFGGAGGIGGIGLVGLVGLNNLFDRDRGRGGCDNNDNCTREAAILAAIGNAKDQTVAEGRAAAAAFALTNDNVKDSQFALALQANNNTQAIQNQAQAFAIQADRRADELAAAGVTQTASILAAITQNEINNLRDQLLETRRGRDLDVIRIENNNTNTNIQGQFQAQAQAQLQRDLDEHRRRFDSREIEINNINTNTNVQAQLQAQAQAQLVREHDNNRRWDSLLGSFNQLNKSTNDVINFGTMAASANQANTQQNAKS